VDGKQSTTWWLSVANEGNDMSHEGNRIDARNEAMRELGIEQQSDIKAQRTWPDQRLRRMWIAAGGEFHGPRIEHGSMPESTLLPFLRRIITKGPAAVSE
jgi:hypothetical protein